MKLTPIALAGAASAEGLLPFLTLPSGIKSMSHHISTANAPSGAGFKYPVPHSSRGGNAVCVSGTVHVPASTSQNVQFSYKIPQNQTQVTETFLDFITPGSNFASSINAGTRNVSGTYALGATLCTPANNTKPKGVQLLTHGVGLDRYYWDFTADYSYVDRAVEAGYATFFYDRLGVGESEKPDALDVVQAPLEVEIANSLATMLRKGAFGGDAFEKIVGVGHSFGSIITQAVTSQHPAALDAAILTGFSTDTSSLPIFLQGLNLALANQNEPVRFYTLSNGHLVSDNIISQQIGFFRAPGFNPAILQLAELTKASVTFGELFTTSAVTAPAGNYSNPVAVVNGVNDLPFCGGNCTSPMNLAMAVRPALYPQLTGERFGSYLAPVCGHALNFHYAAADAFDYIQAFLRKQNLGM